MLGYRSLSDSDRRRLRDRQRKGAGPRDNSAAYGTLGNGIGSWLIVGRRQGGASLVLGTFLRQKEAERVAGCMRAHLTQYTEIEVEQMTARP